MAKFEIAVTYEMKAPTTVELPDNRDLADVKSIRCEWNKAHFLFNDGAEWEAELKDPSQDHDWITSQDHEWVKTPVGMTIYDCPDGGGTPTALSEVRMTNLEQTADRMVIELERGWEEKDWIDDILRLSRLPQKTSNATTTLVEMIVQRVEAKYDYDNNKGWIERTHT